MRKSIPGYDMRYRGPLSYRGLRLIALLALTASQISALVLGMRKLAGFISPETAEKVVSSGMSVLLTVLQNAGAITFPLLLIASMSIVLRNREKIFKVMLSNFLLAALTYLFIVKFAEGLIMILIRSVPEVLQQTPEFDQSLKSVLTALINTYTGGDIAGTVVSRGVSMYVLAPVLSTVTGAEVTVDNAMQFLSELNASDLAEMVLKELPEILRSLNLDTDQLMDYIAQTATEQIVRSHLNVNVFLDLFLCTVVLFFVQYQPKKLTGGKLMLFRCCAVLPVCYLLVGVVLTGMNRAEWVELNLPLWLVGLLPSRKLPGLMLFFSMILYVKYHEIEIIAKGGGKNEINAYMQSNRGSFRFSLFICAVLAFLSLADWAMSFVDGGRLASWGIGVTPTMFFAIPFVLLFSFKRKPRFKVLDGFVPVYYILHYFIIFAVAAYLLGSIPEFL